MNIREQEDKLFDEWKNARPNRTGFVPDGVVSEEDYLNSDLKIVFILKEVNDPGSKGWDLRKYLRGGADKGGTTWNNVARWVYGIRNRESMPEWIYERKNRKPIPEWKDFPEADKKDRAEQLKTICAFNLKKEPGGSSTDYEKLKAIAKEDSLFIRRQYKIYNPDLTICCGSDSGSTGDMFRDAMGYTDTEETEGWKQTKRGVWWYESGEEKYVVIFNHPSARIRGSFLFYGLVDAVNEIYDKK